jgi:acyl-CoA reductase-like NAD-dependent aldehyde dehydrogenase
VSVISFKDEDDLIKQANDTIYGSRRDLDQRHHARAPFRERDQSGCCLDQYFNMFNAASPFGGYKQSGYGARWAATRSIFTRR